MKKIKKKMITFVTTMIMMVLMLSITVLADPVIVTGTKKLLNWSITTLVGIEAGATGFFAIKDVIKYKAATPEEKKPILKEIIHTIAAGVAGITMTGTIAFVFSYYT